MACAECGREPEPGDRFCRSCGTPFVLALPDTPALVPGPAAALPCPNCGRELTYVRMYDRLYCHACTRYAPKGYGQTAMAPGVGGTTPPTASAAAKRPDLTASMVGFLVVGLALLIAAYLVTRSSILFAGCCVPAGFVVVILLVGGLMKSSRKAFRGDLL